MLPETSDLEKVKHEEKIILQKAWQVPWSARTVAYHRTVSRQRMSSEMKLAA